MCSSGPKVTQAPAPPPPPPTPPRLESPSDTSEESTVSSTKASKTARSKLRIDLDPLASSVSGAASGLGIPTQ